MEKEMKKLLLVAVCVGIFLLVILGVAFNILPKSQSQDASFSSSASFAQGRVQPAAEIMSNLPQDPVSIIEVIDPVTAIDVDNGISRGDSLTIQVPIPSTAAVPDNIVTVSQPVRTVTTTTPVTAAPSAQSTASTRTTSAPKTINDYWIQVGAYSAIVRAEDMKELLASKGLISIIENRLINGQNLYRVRLGPYTSEREANHWLAIVKAIDGFNESQVRQTVRQQ